MDELVYLGFTVLELSKKLMYETYYDKLQPYFGLDNIKLHFMDCDCFVLSIRTKNIINDSKNPEFLFDFTILIKTMNYSEKKRKSSGQIQRRNL